MSTPPDQLPRAQPELPFPPLQERRVLGRPVIGYDLKNAGLLPRSYWQRVNAAWNDTWHLTASRWRQLFEPDDEFINTDEFLKIAEGTDVKFRLNMTRAEAERRADIARREQHAARFESDFFTGLIGSAVPALFDPVSVITLPVGGANFARAAGAKTWSTLLKQNALGGIKAGVAAAPLEIGFQMGERENLNTGMLLGTVLGPAVGAPVIGAVGRGIGRVLDGSLLNAATRNRGTNAARPPGETVNAFKRADQDGLPTPPPLMRQTPMDTPTARLKSMFGDYEGGHQQWIRDLGLRRQAATDKAIALGIDPDGIEIRNLLETLSRQTDARSRTPSDYNAQLLSFIKQHQRGKLNDFHQRFLEAEGLLDGNTRELTVLGKRLAKALNKRESAVLRRFIADGPTYLRNELRRYEDSIIAPNDGKPTSGPQQVLFEDSSPRVFTDEDIAPNDGKPTSGPQQVLFDEDIAPNDGKPTSGPQQALPITGETGRGLLDGIPKPIDFDHPGIIIQHLEAAMLNRKQVESADAPIAGVSRVPEPGEPGFRPTPVQEEIDLIVKTAEQQGVDTSSIRETLREVRESMKRCGDQ